MSEKNSITTNGTSHRMLWRCTASTKNSSAVTEFYQAAGPCGCSCEITGLSIDNYYGRVLTGASVPVYVNTNGCNACTTADTKYYESSVPTIYYNNGSNYTFPSTAGSVTFISKNNTAKTITVTVVDNAKCLYSINAYGTMIDNMGWYITNVDYENYSDWYGGGAPAKATAHTQKMSRQLNFCSTYYYTSDNNGYEMTAGMSYYAYCCVNADFSGTIYKYKINVPSPIADVTVTDNDVTLFYVQ